MISVLLLAMKRGLQQLWMLHKVKNYDCIDSRKAQRQDGQIVAGQTQGRDANEHTEQTSHASWPAVTHLS